MLHIAVAEMVGLGRDIRPPPRKKKNEIWQMDSAQFIDYILPLKWNTYKESWECFYAMKKQTDMLIVWAC